MKITYEQKQILIGGMLGDMCIFKDRNARRYRMNFAHCLTQSEYFFFKYNILRDIFCTEPKVRSWIDKRTKNTYWEIRAQSITSDFFTDLYHKWYRNGKRTINEDVYNIEPLGLAIWFLDDGYKASTGGLYLATNRYGEKNIEKLRDMLQVNFGINTNVHGKKIYIPKNSADILRSEVIKFTPKSMLYKLIV